MHAWNLLQELQNKVFRLFFTFFVSEYEFAFNIIPEFQNDLQGTCYDYASVMHYPKSAFATPPGAQNVFPCVDVDLTHHIKPLSAIDIERIRLLYDCAYPVGSG